MLNALLWNLLLTAGLAIVLVLLGRLPSLDRRPALRQWLWLLLLAKLVTPPLIGVPLLPAAAPGDGATAIATPSGDRVKDHASAFDQPVQTNPAVDDEVFGRAGRDANRVVLQDLRIHAQTLIVGGLIAVSLIGTCVLLAVHGVRAAKLLRWLRRAGAENALLAEACAEVASRLAIRDVVRSCVVDARTTPLLCAWRQPLVVVPRQLVDNLSPQQLRGVVAHELAHLLRRDHWTNLFVFVVKVLLWWNPVVWWADRELRGAQELCCDAIAIGCSNADRRAYATTLLKTLDFIQAEPLAPCALVAGMGSSVTILRRFEMIGETRLSYRLSRGTILMLLALGIALVCIPVRAQQQPASPSVSTASDAGGNKEGTAKGVPAQAGAVSSSPADARKTRALGEAGPQTKEKVMGVRPQGNCSISGKVVSDATGQPIAHARLYLFYTPTHAAIFVYTASDGTFIFKDIPKGPFSLETSHTAGYQAEVYNPEGKPGQFRQFSLEDGEQRSGIVLKVKQACRVSGKIVDENGKIPEDIDTLTVLAWFKKDDGKGYENVQARVDRSDGSYLVDGLSDTPVYVMAIDWHAAQRGDAYPPIYYPGTFSRNEAKLITFDKSRSVEGINITLQKEGGLVIEGTVRDESGKPIPEAFVVVHRRDMLFDFVTAYTDEQGRYRMHGLGSGEFAIHVDAVHRGFVRTRGPIDLDDSRKTTQRDFTLARGVMISGKLVDEKGNEWQIGESFGYAHIIEAPTPKDQQKAQGSFSLTGFRNKHRPDDSKRSSGGSFALGEGVYESSQMIFPTKSTFLIQGMMPGRTMIGFSPNKEGQMVVKILHDGQDIMDETFNTKPGQEVKDVTIVIGTK
jgi:beta-lactamase regulating signal transducer with metallopeptidase domain